MVCERPGQRRNRTDAPLVWVGFILTHYLVSLLLAGLVPDLHESAESNFATISRRFGDSHRAQHFLYPLNGCFYLANSGWGITTSPAAGTHQISFLFDQRSGLFP